MNKAEKYDRIKKIVEKADLEHDKESWEILNEIRRYL
jgi:hypothetical protein